MATPSKVTYENALKTVESYEKRQDELKQLAKDLSFKLQQFSQVKFKIDKKNKEILFAGLHKHSKQILIGKSKCKQNDKYEPVIGKLIAVKKALHEDVSNVVELVEPYARGGLVSARGNLYSDSINGITINNGIVASY